MRWSCGNTRSLAIGALVATALSRRPWPDVRWTWRRSASLGAVDDVDGEVPRKKGLDDSALELDPAFWEGAEESEWCAVYINLARRQDRREQLLDKLHFTSPRLAEQIRRIDAVDGQQLTLRNRAVSQIVNDDALDRARHARRRGAYTIVHNEGRLLHFDNHLTMGGIACAMSHRLALKALLAHPTAKWGLILEDDILALVPDAEEVVARAVKSLPEDWDALFLGYHDDAGRPHPAISREADAEIEVPVRLMREPCFGLFAWVVRREAAEDLLSNAFPIGGQVDHAISSWLVRERGRCFQAEPGSMIFFSPKSEEAEDSDIQTMATVDAFMQKFQSWQAYYEHVWGMDSIMDGYLFSEMEDYEDLEEWQEEILTPFSASPSDPGSAPPCDAPPPECSSGSYPDL